MMQRVEEPVSALTTTEALDHALLAASLAVAETRRILADAVAARALLLVDKTCEQIEVVHTAAEAFRVAKGDGYGALTDLEKAVAAAAGYEREARQRAKQYAKLVAKHA